MFLIISSWNFNFLKIIPSSYENSYLIYKMFWTLFCLCFAKIVFKQLKWKNDDKHFSILLYIKWKNACNIILGWPFYLNVYNNTFPMNESIYKFKFILEYNPTIYIDKDSIFFFLNLKIFCWLSFFMKCPLVLWIISFFFILVYEKK